MRTEDKRLGEVAEITPGIAGLTSKGAYSYQVILPNSFTSTGRLEKPETQYREEKVSDQQLLAANDILVKRLNPSYVYVVEPQTTEMVASPNLLVVRPNEGIAPLYLGYLLEQKEIIEQVANVTGNAAAIKAVSAKKLSEVVIPMIPLSEQMAVGELWRLSRRRKQLLFDYIAESDRLLSAAAARILNDGGKNR